MDFLDVILEAKGNKRRTTTPRTTRIDTTKGDEDTTDYTGEETDEKQTIDTTDETDEETTDYTSQSDDSTDEDETVDYTAEEEESDPEEDGSYPTVDTTDDATDDIESTDYTETTDEDSDSTDGGSEENNTDDSESGAEEDPKEKENMRVLLEDFTNLYYMVRNTITKLSNIDKSNAVINKIVSQISSNLNVLKKQLFDFIVFNFSKGKYVTNLYKYNYFLEAFKINVEMLKKINVFTTNSQNN